MDYPKLYFKKESFEIIGCAMRVHSELGSGFLESVYQEAFAIELEEIEIPFEKEKSIPVYYKEKPLRKKFVADFICHQEIIVELKAVESICEEHTLQVYNYLNATGCKLGLLINFGSKSLEFRRIVY
ncbi:MAG: GxxExxY protein [Bacteroidota bacterium]